MSPRGEPAETEGTREHTRVSEPVTVLEGRSLAAGREGDYRSWVQRTIAAGERSSGVRGITVLTPEAGEAGERYLLVSFVDEAAGERWRQSEEWKELSREAAAFSTPHVQSATGTEPWFVVPNREAATPPKWKVSLALVPSAYAIGSAIGLLAEVSLEGLPFLVTNLIVTVCLSFLLTYVGLPLTTRILRSWLYQPSGTNRDTAE